MPKRVDAEEQPLLAATESSEATGPPPSYTGQDEERSIPIVYDHEYSGVRNTYYRRISLMLYTVFFVVLILCTLAVLLLFQQKDAVVNEIIEVQLNQLSIVNSEIAEFLGSVSIDYTRATNAIFRNILMFSTLLVGKFTVVPERELELSIMNEDKTYHFLDVLPLEAIVLEVNQLNQLEIKMTYKIVSMENLIRLTDKFLVDGTFTLRLTDWLAIPHLQVSQVIQVKFEWDSLNQYLPQVSNVTIVEETDRIVATIDVKESKAGKFHLNTTMDFDLMFPCKEKLIALGDDWKISRQQILGEIRDIDNELLECAFFNTMLQRILLNDLIPFNIGFHNACMEIKVPSSYLLDAYSALPNFEDLDISVDNIKVKVTEKDLPRIQCDISFNDTFFQVKDFQRAVSTIDNVVAVSAITTSGESEVSTNGKRKKHKQDPSKRRLQLNLDISFDEIDPINFVELLRKIVQVTTKELTFSTIEIDGMEFKSSILESSLDFNLTNVTVPFDFGFFKDMLNHSSSGLSFSIANVEYVDSTEDTLELNIVTEIFSPQYDISMTGQNIELNISTGGESHLLLGNAAFRDLFVNKRINETDSLDDDEITASVIGSQQKVLPTVLGLRLYKSHWLGEFLGNFVSNKPFQLNPLVVTNPERGYINGVLGELQDFLPNVTLTEFAEPLVQKTTIYLFNQEIEIYFHNPCDNSLLVQIKTGKAYLTEDVNDESTLVGEFKEQEVLMIPPGDSKTHRIPIRINPVSAQVLRKYLNSNNGLQIWSKAELLVFVENFNVGLNYTGSNVAAEVKL